MEDKNRKKNIAIIDKEGKAGDILKKSDKVREASESSEKSQTRVGNPKECVKGCKDKDGECVKECKKSCDEKCTDVCCKDKKVTFDETHNKEYEVVKDKNKAASLSPRVDGKTDHVRKSLDGVSKIFVPPTISSSELAPDSEILRDRNDDKIVAEGWVWKKRRIFCCLWHQKYFVLTRDGMLRYHKADGRRCAKGNWSMREATGVGHQDMPDERHPFRMTVAFQSHTLLLGFDEKNVRDHWLSVLGRHIPSNETLS